MDIFCRGSARVPQVTTSKTIRGRLKNKETYEKLQMTANHDFVFRKSNCFFPSSGTQVV